MKEQKIYLGCQGSMQEIIPKVYLGGKQDALVVNCTPDIPQIERMGVETVRMPIPDGHGDDENSAMAEHLRDL